MYCLTVNNSTKGTDEVEATLTYRVRQVSTELLLRYIYGWSTLEKIGNSALRSSETRPPLCPGHSGFSPKMSLLFFVLLSFLPSFFYTSLSPSFPSLPFGVYMCIRANFRRTSGRTFSPSTWVPRIGLTLSFWLQAPLPSPNPQCVPPLTLYSICSSFVAESFQILCLT